MFYRNELIVINFPSAKIRKKRYEFRVISFDLRVLLR